MTTHNLLYCCVALCSLLSLLSPLGCGPAAPPAAGQAAPLQDSPCLGQVLGAAGQPAEGAEVLAYRLERSKTDTTESYRQAASAAIGADGMFDLGRSASRLLLLARKDGAGMTWRHWSPGEAIVQLRLSEPAEVSGQVVDEDGKGVADATVALSASLKKGDAWVGVVAEPPPPLTTKSDADGRFRFPAIPKGALAEFLVEAPGKARLTTFGRRGMNAVAPATGLRLTLGPEARLEVRVTDRQTGKPVTDVTLVVSRRQGDHRPASTTSPREGLHVFEHLSGGQYNVQVAPTAAAGWALAGAEADLHPGQTQTLALQLVRGEPLEIRVADAQTNSPLAGAFIGMFGKGRGLLGALTGDDGVARFRMEAGDYNIGWIGAGGYTAGGSYKLAIKPGEPFKAEYKLERLPKIHGVVRDTAGEPVPGVHVCVLTDRSTIRTDAQGRFEFTKDFGRWDHLTSHIVIARQAGANLAAWAPLKDSVAPIELKLAPAVVLTGTVEAPAGTLREPSVSVLVGAAWPETLPPLHVVTPEGNRLRYVIADLPAGLDYAVRVTARGQTTVDLMPAERPRAGATQTLPAATLRAVRTARSGPVIRSLDIPPIPGQRAIWGATGRDSRGHIWFSVMAEDVPQPSAHLFELEPATDKIADRGDVVSALKKAGRLRPDEGQMKIHTKIVQGPGGYLYFSSMDEEGENEDTELLPKWGGHLWRLRLSDYSWEHLIATPEALLAISLSGNTVSTLGYFGHVLYQFDIATGQQRRLKVGSMAAHVTRNIVMDRRGHVYAPRVQPDAAGQPVATLVEFDAALKEVANWPLPNYFNSRPRSTHGIIGVVPMPDGSTIFLTHNGWLTRIVPPAKGEAPAKLEQLGWFHPRGPEYCASLFTDAKGAKLMGASNRGHDGGYEWITYDLGGGPTVVAPMLVQQPKDMSLDGALLYGSETRDDLGNFYVVGGLHRPGAKGLSPVVLQVKPVEDGMTDGR